MQVLDLVMLNGHTHRVLSLNENKALVIDCDSLTMPQWVSLSSRLEVVDGTTSEFNNSRYEELSSAKKKSAHTRYTLIAPVLPFVSDEYMRARIIAQIAENENISKQTIRKYLCLYLAYQDIGHLVSCDKASKRTLTEDEKNFRWAINKFYYSPLKHTLKGSYMLMLKEKYTTSEGTLKEGYPAFHRYRYFFNKHKKLQTYYIARDGLTSYQRNHRPLLGQGVSSFASSIGVGMLDSTILDIYLVNDEGKLVGRPVLTACIDAYSGMCCGYALSWEGGIYSLKCLVENIVMDKVSLCKKFGISIEKNDWNCDKLPAVFVTDKGKEYTSSILEQLTEWGVSIVNLPPYRPDLKSRVEQFFNVIQNLYKPHLKTNGVIDVDYQERGAQDYRKAANLTINDLETIIIKCILYYNTKRVVDGFQYPMELLQTKVEPFANAIWNDALNKMGANLIEVTKEMLHFAFLSRGKAIFTRRGLVFSKLRYFANGYTERFLAGGECVVAYDPQHTSYVWLYENGEYIKFTLIDKQFEDVSFESANAQTIAKERFIKSFEEESLQAQVSLIGDIQVVADRGHNKAQVVIADVRETRKKETRKRRMGV